MSNLNELLDNIETIGKESESHAERQSFATLMLVKEQRIANIIAYAAATRNPDHEAIALKAVRDEIMSNGRF